MTRLQALLIAVSVAFAVVAGTYAAMQTTRLGTGATTHVSATYFADQRRKLDRTAAALHKALRQKPPRLPAVPRPAAPTPRYLYVPAPRSASAATTAAPSLTAAPVVTTAPAARPATHSSSSPAASRDGEHRGDHESADD